MSDVFHLNLTKAQLKGATLAIVPGDPARSERIAKKLDNPEFLASTREFTSWLGYLNGQPVVVCSTGIGGPSTSIYRRGRAFRSPVSGAHFPTCQRAGRGGGKRLHPQLRQVQLGRYTRDHQHKSRQR